MKNLIYLVLLLPIYLNAQVGINTTSPNAQLDIRSSSQVTPTNKDGLLIPKIDEYPVSNPTVAQDGMLVFATGDGSVTKGFYYWDNTTSSWILVNTTTGVEKINDLLDGKSDNDGTHDGSSIFLGIEAGLNDDGTDNQNVGIGYQALYNNTTGLWNTANGYKVLFYNTTGYSNSAIGYKSLYENTTGYRNTALGVGALFQNHTGNGNIAIGYSAGLYETGSNKLYIENTSSTSPLIYGEFDNDLLRVNGNLEVEKTTDANITVKTPFGNKASLKLMETNGTNDYGFEFEYDGSADKLNLWSRTFTGNEAQRMTWLKNGNVGISATAPKALLDVSSSNPAAPKNTDGMLVPRINAFPAINPGANQNGMLVFLTTNNTFYYWKQSTTSWVSVNGVQKINDLSDGKSDNDGSSNGSSVFLGINAGNTDDSSDNRNVGIGYQTLHANSIGSTNTALGYQSMKTNSSGFNNVALGTESLFLNTSGHSNTALGDTSLYNNTSGDGNIAIGWEAMKNNLDGNYNIANGYRSLYSNTSGDYNLANGYKALYFNTTGNNNTANGFAALYSNTTGNINVANGYEAMRNNTTGKDNVANGYKALRGNTIGEFNVANGSGALRENTTGNNNTASGALALNKNTTGYKNTANGYAALNRNTTGNRNTAIGLNALYHTTTGHTNTAIGFEAGKTIRDGTGNIFIGHGAGGNSPVNRSNSLYIDNSSTPSPLIYGDFDYDLLQINGNLQVYHDSGSSNGLTIRRRGVGNLEWRFHTINSGSLAMYTNNGLKGIFSSASGAYTAISDRELKKNINTLDNVLDKINKLNVVDYNFIDQKTEDKHVGFIAQEVNKVFPHLVNEPIEEGEDKGYYTMDYSGFGVIAIKAIQEQQKQIETLKQELTEIKALLLKNK
ncbi:MAG: tail fiber domain-containing protein [Flavobacteriaceae bacterium]